MYLEAGEVDPVGAGPVDELLQRRGDVGGPDDQLAPFRAQTGGQAHGRARGRGTKRIRRCVGHEPAPGQNEQSVGEPLGLVHVVRRQEDRGAAVGEALDDRPGLSARRRVEPGGGLVEEQQLGPADDAQAEVDPSLLAAREATDARVGLRCEVDEVEHLAHRPRCGEEPAEHAQRLGDGELGIEAGRLHDEPDAGTPAPVASPRVDAQDGHSAGARSQVALEDLERRRLAGTVAAEQGDDLARTDLEADVVDGDHRAEAVRQVLDGDRGHRDRRALATATRPQTTSAQPMSMIGLTPPLARPSATSPAPMRTRTPGCR
jgi:hypothetical protein